MTEHTLLFLAAFIISLIGTVILESKLIPHLRKRAHQPIYEGGPEWHLKKQGTPTMGGLAFLIAMSVALIFCTVLLFEGGFSAAGCSIIIILVFSVFNSFVGIIDDLTKLHRRENAGLTPLQKLVLQFISVWVLLFAREYFFADGTELHFGNFPLDLKFLYYPVMALLAVGIINFSNLTDGVDGLAASTAVGIGVGLLFVATSADTVSVAAVLIGGSVGFLFFNVNPAKIFMGDTGSLFLGALVAACAFTLEFPLMIILICSVYVLEGGSVIIQVLVYKLTGKRVFKMSPLHHHLEKCNFSETKICLCALILTLVSSLFALSATQLG